MQRSVEPDLGLHNLHMSHKTNGSYAYMDYICFHLVSTRLGILNNTTILVPVSFRINKALSSAKYIHE